MAIALESAGTVTPRSSETSTAVPMPATVTVGTSLLILFGACNSSAQITAVSGWNTWELRSRAGSTSIPDIYIAWRVCDGTEGASVSVTHPNAVSIWQISSWSGVNTTTPLDVAIGENDSTATTNATAPTITPVTANVALLHFSTNNTNTAQSAPPTAPGTFIEICDGTGASKSGAVSYLLNQPASATGSVTATWSVTGSGMAFLVALRPALTASATTALSLGLTAAAARTTVGDASTPLALGLAADSARITTGQTSTPLALGLTAATARITTGATSTALGLGFTAAAISPANGSASTALGLGFTAAMLLIPAPGYLSNSPGPAPTLTNAPFGPFGPRLPADVLYPSLLNFPGG